MKTKIRNWSLVFLWACFIFFLSHQPDLKSNLSGNLDFILRKIAHITEYAVLTFLLIRALSEYKLSNYQVLIWSMFLAIFYAVSDEYHQTFVLLRQGSVRDVLIDSIGIFSVIFLNRKK
ncbi:VanZ family protein [Patescibacteria group bacterium]|nr:VanZ family protein [Patescibacteria group bacterium]MBU2472629.1 VanZ family protein [Patescibacteria group bacterium]